MDSTPHEVPSWANRLSPYQQKKIDWALRKSIERTSKGGVVVTAMGQIDDDRVHFLDIRNLPEVEPGTVEYRDKRKDYHNLPDDSDLKAILTG